ncbi:MAG: transcriptional regulator NrdR [Clostridiales bacterium]|nr:transcriptional regulator NrdR [Clostridiales bacterium]MCF8021347.1 transcriptional regulator NrdR [Clostridiales bacterium]
MKCPYCNYETSKVLDSRSAEKGEAIRRRRECINCERRFTTYERLDEPPLMVVKKDGTREPFDRVKLLSGLAKACKKRKIPTELLEDIITEIEKELMFSPELESTSSDVGEKVLKHLSDIDEVAYVRFASVYRDFDSVKSFMQEIKQLINRHQSQEGYHV